MNKSFLTWIVTGSLLAAALTGCAEKETEPAKKEQTEQTAPDLNDNGQTGQNGEKQDDKQDVPEQPAADPSHAEIQAAFALDDYKQLTPMQIAAVGLGQMELPMEEPERLALAKAMSSAMSKTGWKPGDLPPALFMSTDGTKFAVGMKKSDGKLVLQRYELQTDGTYKLTATDTK